MANNRRFLKFPSTTVLEYHYIPEPPIGHDVTDGFSYVPLGDEIAHYEHAYNVPVPDDFIVVLGYHYMPLGVVEPDGVEWVDNVNSFTSLIDNYGDPISAYFPITDASQPYLREGDNGKYRYYQLVNERCYYQLDSRYPTDLKPGELGVGRRQGHEALFVSSSNTNSNPISFRNYIEGRGIKLVENEINLRIATNTNIGGVSGAVYDAAMHSNYEEVVVNTATGKMYSKPATGTTYGTFTTASAGLVPTATTNTSYVLNAAGGWVEMSSDTTYSTFTTADNGLVPASGANTTKYLKGDGTWGVPTNNTYTATGALSMSGNTFIHTDSGVTEGNYGPNTNVTVGEGESGSMVVPQVTVDKYGHITLVTNRTLSMTIPSIPDPNIEGYEAPVYDTTHVSTTWANVISTNVVANGDTYSEGINKVDNKVAGLSNELGYVEAAMAQAYVDAREADRYYGLCETNADVATKTVSITDYDENEYREGERFIVGFRNGSTIENASLNINNIGAKAIKFNGENVDGKLIVENCKLLLLYKDNAFHIIGGASEPYEILNATTNTATTNGYLVPGAGTNANTNYFLDGTGNWSTPVNTTYGTFTTTGAGLTPTGTTNTNMYLNGMGQWTVPQNDNTTYGTFTTANDGLVPQASTNSNEFLRADGTWVVPTDTTYSTFTTANGLVPGVTTTNTNAYLNAKGGWTIPVDTTYGTFTTGNAGLVPTGNTNTNEFLNAKGQWVVPTDTTYDSLSTSNTNTNTGYLVNGAGVNTNKFLMGDGSWQDPANTTYGTFTSGDNGLVPAFGTNTNGYLNADGTWSIPTDTTYGTFTTGDNGLVPKTGSTNGSFLRDDGTWAIPTDTTYATFGTANGLVPGTTNTTAYLQGDGSWTTPTDTTYGTFTTGNNGLVPKPTTTSTNLFLNAQGQWVNPQDSDTTYGTFTTANAGLTPASGNNTDKYLKGDGTWSTPTNNTYTATGELQVTTNTFTHKNSGVTSGNYGASTDVTIGEGETGSIVVPQVTVNEYGHVTAATNRTLSVTVPSIPDPVISGYTAPTYHSEHLSNTWVNVFSTNVVANGDTYSTAVQKVDTKLSGLADELSYTEAGMAQAYVDAREADRYYGVCSTAAGSAAKTVTIEDYDATNYEEGDRFVIEFPNGSTVANPTLTIGGLPAKNIKFNGSNVDGELIRENNKLLLVYKDNAFHIVGGAGAQYYILNSTTNTATTNGYLVSGAGSNANTNYFLDGTGNWAIPVDTTYGTFSTANNGLVPKPTQSTNNTNLYLNANGGWTNPQDSDTTYGTFGTGYNGLVPMSSTNTNAYLQGNGQWTVPTDTTYGTFTTANGLVPGATTTNTNAYLNVKGGWTVPVDTTYDKLSASNTATNTGYLVSGAGTNTTKFLQGDGSWATPTDTTYGTFTTANGLVPGATTTNTNAYLNAKGGWTVPQNDNTTYGTFTTANEGLVPKASVNTDEFLRSDGTWVVPTDTTYGTFTTANGLVPGRGTNTNAYLQADGSWSVPTNTTYGTFTTASGLVPGRGTNTNAYLQADGSWSIPTDTTYSTFGTGYNGLVPKSGTNTHLFLQGDGSWAKPTDTTYGTFTTSNPGLAPTLNNNASQYLNGQGQWSKPTDTTYDATGVITRSSGNVFSHDTSGVTEGTYGPNTNVTVGGGETASMVVPQVTVDAYGHVTLSNNRTLSITIPAVSDETVSDYEAPTYPTEHVSTTYVNVITTNVIANGNTYSEAINKLDRKLAETGYELAYDEAAMAQAYVDAREADRYYGICTTAAGTAAKTVTINEFDDATLAEGEKFIIQFNNDSTAANPTLQINYTTAYPIKFNGSAVNATTIKAGNKFLVVFKDNAYHLIGGATYEAGIGLTLNTNGQFDLNVATSTSIGGVKGDLYNATTHSNYVKAVINTDGTIYTQDLNTTYATFTTGSNGLVPMSNTNTNAYLKGNGTWSVPTDTTYATLSTANTATTTGYLVKGAGSNAATNYFLNGKGDWAQVQTTDTTYATISSSNTSTTTGFVVPGAGTNTGKYLKGDGSWETPTDTTYAVFTATSNGLVPKPTAANTAKYLRGDGSWITPPDTTYSATGVLSKNSSNVFLHNESSLAAGTYGQASNVSIGGGETGSIVVPQVVTDAYGHIRELNAKTLSITIPAGPDYKITTYSAPTYDTTHLSAQWAAAVGSNAIAVGDTFDAGINRNDNKTKYLADELISTEGAMSQAYVDAREADRYYGTCSAAATNATKMVVISDFDASTLTNGERFVICFTNGSTATNPVLKINNTTAYPIKYNGSAPATNLIQANSRLLMAFNANEYHIVGGAGGSSTTYGIFTSESAGLVPAGGVNSNYVLEASGNWIAIPSGQTYATLDTSNHATNGNYVVHGPGTSTNLFLQGNGSWASPSDTTYGLVSTSSNGLAPKVTNTNAYLQGNGQWTIPTNTTYAVLGTNNSSATHYVVKGMDNSDGNYYLNAKGDWSKPANTTYAILSTSNNNTGTAYTVHGAGTNNNVNYFLNGTGEWSQPPTGSTYGTFTPTEAGLVPAGGSNTNYVLEASGNWIAIPSGQTYATLDSSNHATNGNYVVHGPGVNTNLFLQGNGSWATPTDTTYKALSTADHVATSNYLVVGPGTSTNNFLRGDGQWKTPTDTTYATLSASNSNTGEAYLVAGAGTNNNSNYFLNGAGQWSQPSGGGGSTYATLAANDHASGTSYVVNGPGSSTNLFLQGNGSWAAPANTTYADFNGPSHGLVPAASGASYSTNYVLSGRGTWVPNAGGGGSTQNKTMASYNWIGPTQITFSPSLFVCAFMKPILMDSSVNDCHVFSAGIDITDGPGTGSDGHVPGGFLLWMYAAYLAYLGVDCGHLVWETVGYYDYNNYLVFDDSLGPNHVSSDDILYDNQIKLYTHNWTTYVSTTHGSLPMDINNYIVDATGISGPTNSFIGHRYDMYFSGVDADDTLMATTMTSVFDKIINESIGDTGALDELEQYIFVDKGGIIPLFKGSNMLITCEHRSVPVNGFGTFNF